MPSLTDLRTRAQRLEAQPVLLQVEHLVKEFPVTSGALLQRKIGSVKAVSDVSFAIRTGETFGLVGESGCGKTTIGRLTVALERADSGRILFEGNDIRLLRGKALRDMRRDMQLMFQDPYASLDPRMRVGTILREPFVVQGIGSIGRARREGESASERSRPQSQRRPSSIPTSSPAASANGSGWHGPSRSNPASSSPTSRSPPSTSRSRRRS